MSDTSALRTWIVEQAARGCTVESLVESMVTAGYKAEYSRTMINDTLTNLDSVFEGGVEDLPPRVEVPEPYLVGSPSSIQLSDRKVEVLLHIKHPRIVLFGNFLSDAECDELIQLAENRTEKSLTVDRETGGSVAHDARKSEGMFFQRGEHPLVKTIESRIAELVNWPVEYGEGLQILHYRHAGEYKPHYDYFDPSDPGTKVHVGRGGQRVGTLIMYLGTPEKGGGTVFPDAGVEVSPVKGNAVFFSYDRPHPSSGSLHGGDPVILGDKWIATKWLRQDVFN